MNGLFRHRTGTAVCVKSHLVGIGFKDGIKNNRFILIIFFQRFSFCVCQLFTIGNCRKPAGKSISGTHRNGHGKIAVPNDRNGFGTDIPCGFTVVQRQLKPDIHLCMIGHSLAPCNVKGPDTSVTLLKYNGFQANTTGKCRTTEIFYGGGQINRFQRSAPRKSPGFHRGKLIGKRQFCQCFTAVKGIFSDTPNGRKVHC